MAIDYSVLSLPKHTPAVLERTHKQRTKAKAWRSAKQAVDTRDRVDEAPICFITGKRLQTSNALDEWTFRDRAHIEARSQSKKRAALPANVLSVSRGVHRLIDAHALLLFNKRGQRARSVRTIDHVAWNRRLVAKNEEPIRIRKGLAVRELDGHVVEKD